MNKENYPTWLVPLEIAKELKEIDFNEHCLFAFSTEKNDLYIIQRYKKDCVWYDDISLFYEPVVPTDSFLVPTWTDVFAWFRSKGLFGYVDRLTLVKNKEVYKFYIKCVTNIISDSFKTYEEAREALVKALIRTYKQEQLK